MSKSFWRFYSPFLPGLGASAVLFGIAGAIIATLFGEIGGFSSLFVAYDHQIWRLLSFTLYQAFLSTLLSVIIGIILSWALARQSSFPGRSLLVTLFSSSLVLPSLIAAFGIITVLGRHGWVNSLLSAITGHTFTGSIYGLLGILIAHTYLNGSFAAVNFLKSLESIPVEKYRLSLSLRLTPWQRFRHIEWQAIESAVLPTASVIFMLCFSSFAIVLLLGGNPSYNTLEVAIYEAVRIDFDIPLAVRIASLQLIISTLIILGSMRFKGSLSNLKQSSRLIPWRDPKVYRVLQIIIIALFTLIYTLPFIAIVVEGSRSDIWSILSKDIFLRSLWTSLSLALASALIAVALSLALAQAQASISVDEKNVKGRLSRALSMIIQLSANLYLAVPTMIMGLGFFLLARSMGGDISSYAVAAIIIANVLMSLPFAYAVLTPAFRRVWKRYGRLCQSLGLSPLQQWRYALWPYLRNSLSYVFALSFALSLGDLGVIALFGNKDITTLPWYLYQLMGSYRNSDADGVALILLVLIMVLFSLTNLFRKGIDHA